ncbi:MAG TPA: uroporphyrinogen decarboxylase family protein [Caldilineaceae bacterium]|nr:uroporphyrinogen decarboxylase family protein [Caldilineaceae bacterium]
MIPTFEEKVLEHRGGHYIVQDWMGNITEISDEYDYTYIRTAKDFVTRKWHSAPVKTREDWLREIAWRYDTKHPERFPKDFDERCQAAQNRDTVLSVTVPGVFWQLREWCGFENLCMMFLDDPDLVTEMIALWEQFVLDTLTPILDRVTPDYVQFNEDMAYKGHSMISPAMVRQFILPTWCKWANLLHQHSCPIICLDSDGYVAQLIPLWIEAGFNCTFPIEVAAGNDLVAYREKYGTAMAFLGGIDKRALAVGGSTMRQEVMRVAPVIQSGGYIPGCDHGVPPDISWPNFVEYSRLLAQLTGWL